MATRESLKKLSKSSIQKLCEEVGIDSKGKRKEHLIGQVITSSVPTDIITPVIRQETDVIALFPSVSLLEGTENLPPFNRVRYSVVSVSELPCPSFLAIYNFMVERSRKSVHDNVEAGDEGVSVKNFKGMDRAVRHFDAGDIQDMQISRIGDKVVYVMASCLASMKKDKYTVYLCVTTNERCSVQYAYCQCPIGSRKSVHDNVEAGDEGVSVKNFKGMDRAVRHFDAGDIQDMQISRIDIGPMSGKHRTNIHMLSRYWVEHGFHVGKTSDRHRADILADSGPTSNLLQMEAGQMSART
ncbi:uncharacterized protein LOC110454371 [Mizuhopecten yessoensis]|uniref:uncharacterized protein LOC110454371 n=1 Tax=Mizuhopecten yessoensis TaxID=6573 RepID=UPI000B45DB69|nr:uncharacterized protein LOC110454371 [Mizuhopecten yessoensis]